MTQIPGGKLKMRPLWDFDIAFGNTRQSDNEKTSGFWVKNSIWFERMFQDDYFVKKVKERFLFFMKIKAGFYQLQMNFQKKFKILV